LKSKLAAIALVIVLASLSAVASATVGNDKVSICHIPPGNPDNTHVITVSVHAVAAHLAHGDNLGSCDAFPPPTQ
jgi:hypothetical protein